MERRKAKPGEYVINIESGEILKAKFVLDNGAAVINKYFPVVENMGDDIDLFCWEQDEYLVIPKVDPSMLEG